MGAYQAAFLLDQNPGFVYLCEGTGLKGQLFQMLMLATVLEGRMIRINPYGQPGVEAYKQNMNAILRGN